MLVAERSQVTAERKNDGDLYRTALRIRRVEETFLELFSKGKLNGTVHTCVGQEFSALAFAGQLNSSDFVFSNHRCHGHYLAFTNDVRGLLAELMGKESGTCGGIGSSQHLCKDNFFSNGIQGGITPVAAGFALAQKMAGLASIGIVFIGDGTLGEGVVYETMNIASKWDIPLLMVCENNFYAQSTSIQHNLAGDILSRPKAFGITTFHGATFDPLRLMDSAKEAIDYVRKNQRPAFFLVETYRLNAHSKGDDDRDAQELAAYRAKDPLCQFQAQFPSEYSEYLDEINTSIDGIVGALLTEREMPLDAYVDTDSPAIVDRRWSPIAPVADRQVNRIHHFFSEAMAKNENIVFIGEDILHPYGGAFKVAKDLSQRFPDRVFSTPISEAAITGIANGLALAGKRPFVEIMFGDFTTLCLDQLLNHAAKFHHMYNKQAYCPMVLRTPMGGKRGYGPTHSQTLDKILAGIGVTTVALNTLIDPGIVYASVLNEKHPVIVIENKLDYGKKIGDAALPNYVFLTNDSPYPTVRISPVISTPSLTLVAYGGMVETVLKCIEDLFLEFELIAELIVPTQIYPMDYAPIFDSVSKTRRLAVIEEGTPANGIGAEIVATVSEKMAGAIAVKRIAALPAPIPSCRSLEDQVLPGKERILRELGGMV